jgi:hypothetical protein
MTIPVAVVVTGTNHPTTAKTPWVYIFVSPFLVRIACETTTRGQLSNHHEHPVDYIPFFVVRQWQVVVLFCQSNYLHVRSANDPV